tara:strand:- start:125 stop:652 length:528 start_codon:yes stop_codon:yes gene_type:complete
MPIRVREGNTWKLVANPIGIPATVTGLYEYYGPGETTEKVANTTYTNNTTKLIHVSATVGIDRNTSIGSGQNAKDLIAGSYTRAFITPTSTKSLLSNPLDNNLNVVSGVTEVANIRDNGNQNTEYLFLNPQFFVPVGYSYILKIYKSNDNDWSQSTNYPDAIETFAWSEFKFQLQ